MIEQRRIFILGNSLLSDGLVHLLTSNQHVAIIGCAYALEDVLPFLESGQLDMLVVAGMSGFVEEMAGKLFESFTNIPVLLVHPDKTYMELFSLRRVTARYADLANAIEMIP